MRVQFRFHKQQVCLPCIRAEYRGVVCRMLVCLEVYDVVNNRKSQTCREQHNEASRESTQVYPSPSRRAVSQTNHSIHTPPDAFARTQPTLAQQLRKRSRKSTQPPEQYVRSHRSSTEVIHSRYRHAIELLGEAATLRVDLGEVGSRGLTLLDRRLATPSVAAMPFRLHL